MGLLVWRPSEPTNATTRRRSVDARRRDGAGVLRIAVVAAILLGGSTVAAQRNGERLLQSAHAMLSRNLDTEAAAEYRDAIGALRDEQLLAEARYGLGVSLSRQGEIDAAIEALDSVQPSIEFPYRTDTHLLLARLLAEKGQTSRALQTVRQTLGARSHASWPDAVALAIELSHRTEEHSDAIRLYETEGEHLPPTAASASARAALYAGLSLAEVADTHSEFEAAAEVLERADVSSADDEIRGYALLAAAEVWSRARNAARAESAYRSTLASPASELHARASIGLSMLLRGQGRSPEAAEALTALDLDLLEGGVLADVNMELGLALFDAGQLDRAAHAFDRVLNAEDPGDLAAARYWRAKVDLDLGHAQAAASRLQSLLDTTEALSNEPSIRYDLGLAFHRAGHDYDARRQFGTILESFPDSALAERAHLAELSLALSLDHSKQAADLASSFVQAFPRSKNRQYAFVVLAEALLDIGETDDAMNAAKQAVDGDEDALTARAMLILGLAHNVRGETDQARARLTAAASILDDSPMSAAAHITLARLAAEAEDWHAVLDSAGAFEAVCQPDHPQRREARLLFGTAQSRLGRPLAAIATLEAITQGTVLDEVAAHARYELGQLYTENGSGDMALQVVSTLVKDQPEASCWPHAARLLASLHAERGDTETAEEWFRRAASSGHTDVAAASLRDHANLLLSLGRPSDAASVLDKSKSADGLALRVIALSRAGEHERAIRDSERFDESEVTLRVLEEYELHIADSYRSSGNTEAAMQRLTALLDSARFGAEAAYRLAAIAIEREDFEGAAAVLAAALEANESLDPERRASLAYQLAWCTYQLEDPARVVEILDDGICDIEPTESLASQLLGEALSDLSQHAAATERFTRALEHDLPNERREPLLLRLGEASASAQLWATSRTAYESHRTEFPESDSWFMAEFGLGWALENLGEPSTAMTHYRAVTDSHEGLSAARAQFQIGECLFALGRHEDAIREFLRVDTMHNQPQWSAAALFEAGRCFEAVNKIGEARSQYRAVLDRHESSAWAEASRERLAVLAEPGGIR